SGLPGQIRGCPARSRLPARTARGRRLPEPRRGRVNPAMIRGGTSWLAYPGGRPVRARRPSAPWGKGQPSRTQPAGSEVEAILTNLPQAPNSFVGRERELAELLRLVRVTRALTLCGAGGIGKTRLALRILAAAADEFPDGTWFVELGDL